MPPRARRHLFRLSERGDPAARVVTAALFAPLVLLLIVTAMTWRSERRIAVVTDRVVHNYAAIAVWQYARHASRALHDEAMEAVSHMPAGSRMRSEMSAQLGHPSTLLAERGSTDNAFVERAEFAFTFEADSGRITSAGADPSEATLAMLRRQLDAVTAQARKGEEPHHVRFDSAGGRDYAIALSLVWLSDAKLAAKGTVVQAAALDSLFAGVMRDADLLPAVADRRALDRDGIALRLTRPDGATVFATRAPLASTAAVDTTGIQNGVLHATLDLPPAVARELLVGAAPASLLPALGLMLLMSAALAGTGLVHQRRSRALEQARARFVANVSHELRTPLAQISMFAETLHLRRERSDAEGRRFASIMFAEARRLAALVENVLRFSRLEHGEAKVRRKQQPLAPVLINAVNTFAPIAAEADASIGVSAPEELSASLDAAAFHQIVLNLLDNAVKHGGRGVSVELIAQRADGNVVLMVADSGPGIPASERERIFEPFAQLDGRNVAGAGIGLAIVSDLVLAHGGRVRIDDSPLGGARVVIVLPAPSPEAVTPDEAHAEAVG